MRRQRDSFPQQLSASATGSHQAGATLPGAYDEDMRRIHSHADAKRGPKRIVPALAACASSASVLRAAVAAGASVEDAAGAANAAAATARVAAEAAQAAADAAAAAATEDGTCEGEHEAPAEAAKSARRIADCTQRAATEIDRSLWHTTFAADVAEWQRQCPYPQYKYVAVQSSRDPSATTSRRCCCGTFA